MPGPVPTPTPPPPPPPPAASSTPQARCVLLTRPNAAVPSELLNSLAKRIGRIVSCTSAYGAMAEVCAAERDRMAAQAGNSTTSPGTVLLLVEPLQLADAAELVSQLQIFSPGAVCWKYESGANPRLSAVVESDVATWSAAQTIGQQPATRGQSAATGSVARSAHTANDTRTGQRQTSPNSSPPGGATIPSPRHAASTSLPPQAPVTAASHRLRLAGASLPDPSGPLPESPEIVVRPQPKPNRAASTAPPSPPTPPSLTLRGTMPPEDPTSPPRSRALLSADELRMLLGDDPIDDSSSNGTGAAARGGDQ